MDLSHQYHSASAEETQAIGEKLATVLDVRVVCLYGELGSGKTTFTQGFAKGLGFQGRLLSPTFIIMRQYDIPNNQLFCHIDLYRINGIDDIKALGLPEVLSNPNAIVVIEWPEKIAALLPEKRLELFFTADTENSRLITVKI